jgi:aerobic carbon-monoxide dehydrogenase small subunit
MTTGLTQPGGEAGGADGMLWHWRCTVNGQEVERDLPVGTTLLDALRDHCCLTGTKGACLEGECGSCTVILDGKPVNSCLVLAAQAQDCEVLTIEGLAHDGRLHVLQEKFLATGAAQCGYCTPGLIMAAAALLQKNPAPTPEEFHHGMEGNICRCTGYKAISDAIWQAAKEWSGPEGVKT